MGGRRCVSGRGRNNDRGTDRSAVASRHGQIFARLYFEVEPDADEEEAARVPNMSNPVGNTVEKFRSRPDESRRGTKRARALGPESGRMI